MGVLLSMYAMPAYAFAALLFIARGYSMSWASPAVFVVSTYLLSGIATLLLDPLNLIGFNFIHDWTMVAAYIAIIAVCMLPAFLIRRPAPLDLFDNQLMATVLAIMAPLAWYSLFYQLPYAIDAFGQGAETTRYILNVEKTSSLPPNLFTTVAVGVSFFYPLYILAFIEGIARKRNALYLLSCFAGAAAYVVNGICFTARDAFIWFVLTYLYAYWIYGTLLKPQIRMLLRAIIIGLALLCLTGLAIFTIQRFNKDNAVESVYSYLGQQPYVFAETVAEQKYFYGLNLRFPLVAQAMGTYDEVVRTRTYEWSFGGFAKDFYAVAGMRWALVITLLFTLGSCAAILLTRRQTSPAHMLFCYVYLQFMVQGMFYFRLGSSSGNQYYLLIFLLIGGLHLLAKPSTVPQPVPLER